MVHSQSFPVESELMYSKLYNLIRLGAVLLTLLILAGHHYLPPKHSVLHPVTGYAVDLYSDGEAGGKSRAEWLNQEEFLLRCHLAKSELYPVCGVTIHFPDLPGQVLDLSGYQELLINLAYQGDARNIGVFLRNHNPAYSNLDDLDSLKYSSVTVRASDFTEQSTTIHLSEFSTADWWIEQHNIPREYAKPELTGVTAIGVNLPAPHAFGHHDLHLKSIHLVGEWISREQLYLTVIFLWIGLLAWEAASRLTQLYQHNKLYTQKLDHLTGYTQMLQQETTKYKNLSHHDALTGALNRSGLASSVERLFDKASSETPVSVIVFDIDHFKPVNDQRGHDAGDRILKDLASLVHLNTRQQDAFARWGGEEFVLLCSATDRNAAQGLAEKLRTLIYQHTFEPQEPLEITISLGIAVVKDGEDFEAAFKRADEALFRAKDMGRNRAELAN